MPRLPALDIDSRAITISLVFAQSVNGVIGHDGRLVWNIREDMRFFKELTLHHTLLMGRITYEGFDHPLKHRICLVLTKQKIEKSSDAHIHFFPTVGSALDFVPSSSELMIVGGVDLFHFFLPHAHHIFVTCINQHASGNVQFDLFAKAPFQKYRDFCFSDTQQTTTVTNFLGWQLIAKKKLTPVARAFCFTYIHDKKKTGNNKIHENQEKRLIPQKLEQKLKNLHFSPINNLISFS